MWLLWLTRNWKLVAAIGGVILLGLIYWAWHTHVVNQARATYVAQMQAAATAELAKFARTEDLTRQALGIVTIKRQANVESAIIAVQKQPDAQKVAGPSWDALSDQLSVLQKEIAP